MNTITGRFQLMLMVAAFVTVACGSAEEVAETGTTTAPASTTEAAAPATTATSVATVVSSTSGPEVDPDEWVARVNEARTPFGEAMQEVLFGKGDPSRDGWGSLGFEVEFWQLEHDAHVAYAEAMANPPAVIEHAATAWANVHLEHAEALTDHIALIDASGVGYETMIADLFDGPDEVLLEGPFLDLLTSSNLCFDVLVTADEAGIETILDCTGSEAEPEVIEIATGDDGVGVVPVGQHDLEPGRYAFDHLTRPFSIELTEPTSVVVGETDVEVFVEAAGYAPFFTFAVVDDVVAAPNLIDNRITSGFDFDDLVPADDFAAWFDALPFEIESGTSNPGGFDANYWRLLDVEFTGGELPMFGWAESSINPGHLLTPGSVFWEIPHPDGAIIMYATKVVEAPDDVRSDLRLAIGELMLELVELR